MWNCSSGWRSNGRTCSKDGKLGTDVTIDWFCVVPEEETLRFCIPGWRRRSKWEEVYVLVGLGCLLR